MCGIVYSQSFTGLPVNNAILQVFDKQRHRGTEGFGLFDGQEGHMVRETKEDNILKWLCKYDSNLILFHHRWPTSTANTKNTAHPLSTYKYFGDNQYILVHNGHINNSWKLKQDHEALGIKYSATEKGSTKFNDSESLLWDVALTLEGKQKKLEAVGMIAFICIKLRKGKLDKMYFGRNNNPLHLLRNQEGISLSSEGEGELIAPGILYTWNYELKRLTTKLFAIPDSYSYEPMSNTWNQASELYGSNGTRWQGGYSSDTQNSYDTYQERWEYPEEEDEIAYAPPTTEGVEMAMKYLFHRKGNFEHAYEDLEWDYSQIAEDMHTLEEYEESRILEEAMRYLLADSEWLDEHTISSAYTGMELVAA